MQPYDYKYEHKNVNEIRHLLNSQTHSQSHFETGLRSYSTRKTGKDVRQKQLNEVVAEIM
jgi:hypothetical protein